jgi:hypothetical protein
MVGFAALDILSRIMNSSRPLPDPWATLRLKYS